MAWGPEAQGIAALALFVRVLKAAPELASADAAEAWGFACEGLDTWADELPEPVGDEDATWTTFARLWATTQKAMGQRPHEIAHRFAAEQLLDLAGIWPDIGQRELILTSAAGWLQLTQGPGAAIWMSHRTWAPRLKCRPGIVGTILASVRAHDLLRWNGRGGRNVKDGATWLAPEHLFAVHRVSTLAEHLDDEGVTEFRLAFEALPKSAEAIAAESLAKPPARKWLPSLAVVKARAAGNVTSLRTRKTS